MAERSEVDTVEERPITSPIPPIHPRSESRELNRSFLASVLTVELVMRRRDAGMGSTVVEDVKEPFLKVPPLLKFELVTNVAVSVIPIIRFAP